MAAAELQVGHEAGGVQIIEYTKRDLKELLSDSNFWSQTKLPITKPRVLSQVSNPRADENDTVLITAYYNGELVAYLGVLPDLVMSESQTPTKFGWLTAWWVDKESEHRLAATKILFSAMKRYSSRIAISSFSADAKRVYDGTRLFQELARFDRTYFILALQPSLGVLSRLMRWVVGAKNRRMFRRKLQSRGLKIKTVESFSEGLGSFIKTRTIKDPLERDTSCWSWILEFPWVSTSADDEVAQRSYAFSLFAKGFRQIPMVVERCGRIVALLVTTLRDERLSLKYAYYDSRDASDVATALKAAIASINPWLFVCADSELITELRKGFPFYLARWQKRDVAYVAKAFPLSLCSRPQMGIGDNIFT